MSTVAKYAWAAGFFDGEGASYVTDRESKRQRANVCISISQAHREPLDKFAAIVGEGKVRGPYRHGDHRPMFQYMAYGHERTGRIMAKLWPELGSEKRLQYETAREFVEALGAPYSTLSAKCRRGHEDWVMTKRGRVCRPCRNASNAKSRERRREKKIAEGWTDGRVERGPKKRAARRMA